MSAATLNQVIACVRRLSDTDTRRLSDRQLLERFTHERDESAFAELVRRAVSPQELLATIYQAVGVDASKKNRAPGGQDIPLVEKGNHAVKQALR